LGYEGGGKEGGKGKEGRIENVTKKRSKQKNKEKKTDHFHP